MRLQPTANYGRCRFEACSNRADCTCGDCKRDFCPDHSYDVVHSGGIYRGTVCETDMNKRLSLYTGVSPKHFIPRGNQSSEGHAS